MEYGNTAVIFMVIAVVMFALGLAYLGTYLLEKDVDENAG
jgi:hypothetical protein